MTTAPLNLDLKRISPQAGAMNAHEPAPRLMTYICLQQTIEGQASYAHVHEIIRGLTDLGWNVTLREIRADRTRRHGKLYFLWHYLRPQIKLWLLPGERPDVMYIRADSLALPAFLWARLRRIPVVQEVNGPHTDRLVAKRWLRPVAGILAWAQRYQYRHSTALIAVTEKLAEWLSQEAPGVPIHLVPNGANTRMFHPNARTNFGTPTQYVTMVGLLARWQGVPLLLDAAMHRDWPEDVDVVIAGDGDEAERVRRAARVNPKINYLGNIPYAEVPGIVARSLAGLSLKTSIPERTDTGMSPLKLYETLACGVPAIVTEYHGQSDLVRDLDAGIVIPQNDPGALARAVARLVRNEDERREFGRRGADAVHSQHSWHQRAEIVDQVLRSIVPPSTKRRSTVSPESLEPIR